MIDASSTLPASPGPVTRGAAWKVVLSVVLVAGAVAYLLKASVKEGVDAYRHVDEVMADPARYRGRHLQVHGNVVGGSIEQAKGTLSYRFKIETGAMSRPEPRPAAVITATYSGLVPDTFKDGAEIVAKGMLGPGDRLEVVPDGIMAKCPSKYEASPTVKLNDPTVAGK